MLRDRMKLLGRLYEHREFEMCSSHFCGLRNWSKKFLWSRYSLTGGILVLLGWKHIPKGNWSHMNALSAVSPQKLFLNTLHLFCMCENCLIVATYFFLLWDFIYASSWLNYIRFIAKLLYYLYPNQSTSLEKT